MFSTSTPAFLLPGCVKMRFKAVATLVAAVTNSTTPPVRHACDAGSMPDGALPLFCDSTKPIQQRIDDLISRLTLDEKVTLVGNTAGKVESQGIQAYQWWSEALHGVGLSPGVTFEDPTPYATSFPQVVTTSHSFNLKLVHAVASAIGTEGRAFANAGHAGLTFWAPNINIFRDPRWGRGQETPGEDPFYSGQYAATFVKGMQEGEDPRYLKTSACCKHFAAYSVENLYNGTSRHDFNAIVAPQDYADSYLPAFKACVMQGNATSLMCSYNSINGVPACADHDLLNGRARSEWGFDGYVTSDCGAIDDVEVHHNYTSTDEDTCATTLKAGTDLDCGSFYQEHLPGAYQSGKVTDKELDAALQNLFRVQYRLGLFDPPEQQIYAKYGTDRINSLPHQVLALEAARQGMVLLKNRKGSVLPLQASALKSLAVIGPHGNASLPMLGNYNGWPAKIITPYDGLIKYVPGAELVPGCGINDEDETGIEAAVEAAKKADAAVVVVGLDKSVEDEGRDRTSIQLPGVQKKMIQQVAAASQGPVVLVLLSGGAVDLAFAKEDENIDAIVFAGYPGQSGGQAIAETVFGDNNPAGRLTQTFYTEDFVAKVDMGDMAMRPSPGNGDLGRTYRFFKGDVVYPFGHGLSYTTFTVEGVNCTSSATASSRKGASLIGGGGGGGGGNWRQHELVLTTRGEGEGGKDKKVLAELCFQVTNAGDVGGRHSLLAFLTPPPDSVAGQPLSFLAGIGVIDSLAPGKSRMGRITLTEADVTLADETGAFQVVAGQWGVEVGSNFKASFIVPAPSRP